MAFEPNKKTSLVDLLGHGESKKKPVTPKKTIRSKTPLKDVLGDEFLAVLYDWMASGHPDIVKTRTGGLHASSLWQTCGRREILCANNTIESVPREFTAGGLQTTDEGHVLHQLWQDNYLANWGRLKGHWSCVACKHKMTAEIIERPTSCPSCGDVEFRYEEVGVYIKSVKVTGSCDGIVDWRGEDRVFELKTKSIAQFRGIHFPDPAHVIQAHAYMKGLKLKEAFIVYIQKGKLASWRRPGGVWKCTGATAKCFRVPWDDDIWGRVERMVYYHHKAINDLKNDSVEIIENYPRTCPSKKCELAKGCPVKDKCFELGPALKV